MLRLLIADDEKVIRQTISTLIDWESLNIEVVGLCKNGLEAYDAILDKYPDIVLTDIQMPKLSGLELIRKITQNKDNIQFIILSGYDEFSYAKEAMGYGIKHYILKPCSEEEIIAAVKEAVKDHYEKIALQNAYQDRNSLYFWEYVYSDMLMRVLSSQQPLKQIVEICESHIDFYHTGYQLYYLFYLEESRLPACLAKLRRLMETRRIPYIYAFVYVKNTLLFFLPDVQKDFGKTDEVLCQELGMDDGDKTESCRRESYGNLCALLKVLRLKVKRYAAIYLYSCSQCLSICNYDSLFTEVMALSDRLFEAEEDVQDLLAELEKLLLSVTNVEFLRSIGNGLLVQLIHLNDFYSVNDAVDFMMQMNHMSDYQEICGFIIGKLHKAYTGLSGFKACKPFIQEILDYTNEHISSPNLTLKWIAENHLYMNVDYVSRQFVLQVGKRFSTYLNELRINKAKKLLLDGSNEKIYCVAEQVGCGNNPQYFSHLFKKYTRMTPKEFIQSQK